MNPQNRVRVTVIETELSADEIADLIAGRQRHATPDVPDRVAGPPVRHEAVEPVPPPELFACSRDGCTTIGEADAAFGFRKMPNGELKRQLWCRKCRAEAAQRSREKKKAEKQVRRLRVAGARG
jgi:hypothetical protein